MSWEREFDDWARETLPELRVACEEPMSRHTSFHIGGPARRMAFPDRAEQLAVGEQFYIIPLYAMKSVNLVNPQVTGIRQIPASGSLEYRYADIG